MTHRSRTGACSLCGWREGDGVRECYYDERLGSVQHGNRYPTGLTEEQAALYGAYEHPLSGTLHYLSGEHRAQMAERMLQYQLLSAVGLPVLTLPHGDHATAVQGVKLWTLDRRLCEMASLLGVEA